VITTLSPACVPAACPIRSSACPSVAPS
jgi:hypothetical protein